MESMTYTRRRSEIEHYFDRTAADAWSKLTSDAPVSRIRATVRAGRDRMRENLLGWLPADLTGRRILDAGCGTGAFSEQAARRGAEVVAIDLSPTLIELAKERVPERIGKGTIRFLSGDMLDPALGRFDHVVAMDSLIHYGTDDVLKALDRLAERTDVSIIFTFAPRTPALSVMHTVGRLFPRGDRAPSIVPVSADKLRRGIGSTAGLSDWRIGRSERVDSGFYMSQGQEIVRK